MVACKRLLSVVGLINIREVNSWVHRVIAAGVIVDAVGRRLVGLHAHLH